MTNLELFRLLITEFSTIDDVTVQAYIDNADSLISSSISENLRNNLIVYYAAFSIDTAQRWAGSKGQVESITVGGVSMSYGTIHGTSEGYIDLDASVYGRRYKSLLKSSVISITTRNV